MKLNCCVSAALLIAIVSAPLVADDKTDAAASPTVAKKLEELKPQQDDGQALNKFFSGEFRAISLLVNDDKAKEALQRLDELEAIVSKLDPKSDDGKLWLKRGKGAIPQFRNFAELSLATLDDLKLKLKENPTDRGALSKLLQKASQKIGGIARSKPDEAEKGIADLKAFLTSLDVEEAQKKQIVNTANSAFRRIESSIASAKKLLALVGKPAAEMKVEAWVNGSPLTNEELKGKVVLLDFWAVWCGPCIATFPHLREWQEKYGEKDFVMIGLTRYYNYAWDDAQNKATRRNAAQEKVSPEDEQVMLGKFAEQHNLHHRLGVQTNNDLSSYYGVSGIPHVVVIDKEGVVRMIRVGSGPQNAKDIGDLLEQLVNG